MKRKIVFALLLFCICSSSCKNVVNSGTKQPDKKTRKNRIEREPEIQAEDNKEMRKNKRLISDAIGLEDVDKIESILYACAFVKAGEIRKPTCWKKDSYVYLDVVAEDGRNLRVLLSGDYYFKAVQNRDTGEWLIRSQQ